MGEKSLLLLVAEAPVVLRARIEEAEALFRSPDGRLQRPVVQARALEILKGGASFDVVRFAQHGHGVVSYRAGQEVLLFLAPIGSRRELAALAELPGAPTHLSTQEHDQAFVLDAGTRDVLLGAVRDYVRAQAPPGSLAAAGASPPDAAPAGGASGVLDADARRALVRRGTLALLTSGDARLGASALAGLATAGGDGLLRREDVPRLEGVIRDARVSVGFRAALLAELAARGLVEGDVHWRALIESAPPADRGAALRAAGNVAGPSVRALLVERVEDPDPRVAAEAVLALGRPGRSELVPVLARALASEHARVRGAAVRGLVAIGGPEAAAVLAEAGRANADAATRRRARAAAARLASGPAE